MLSSPPEHTHKWTVAVRSAASNPLPPLNQKELAVVGSNLNPANGAQDGAGLQEGTAAEQSRISTRGRETETDYHRLVGGKDDISHFIKRVQFRLHETYPSPTRSEYLLDCSHRIEQEVILFFDVCFFSILPFCF